MTVFANDRALLLAFRAGDAEALAHVYWHYVEVVERACRFGIRSGAMRIPGASGPDELAELVQETFTRAFAQGARRAYDGIRPYRPYLLRIVRNLLVDRMRAFDRSRRVGDLDDDVLAELEIDDSPAPEDAVVIRELQRATAVFLGTLDPEARTFVHLRFEEEQSQDQVAAHMGITRRRVRTLETHTRTALLEHLEREGLAAAFRAVVRGEISSITRPNSTATA